jgi:hypothetical protein
MLLLVVHGNLGGFKALRADQGWPRPGAGWTSVSCQRAAGGFYDTPSLIDTGGGGFGERRPTASRPRGWVCAVMAPTPSRPRPRSRHRRSPESTGSTSTSSTCTSSSPGPPIHVQVAAATGRAARGRKARVRTASTVRRMRLISRCSFNVRTQRARRCEALTPCPPLPPPLPPSPGEGGRNRADLSGLWPCFSEEPFVGVPPLPAWGRGGAGERDRGHRR